MMAKYVGRFIGLNKKINQWSKATKGLKKDVRKRIDWYSTTIKSEMQNKAPTDLVTLKNSIQKIKKSNDNHVVTLYPNIPYWQYQEYGVRPRWVVVDTKPMLQDWLTRHPQVKTRKSYWPEMGTTVDMLFVGGRNTRLGTENKFAYKGKEVIEKNHKESLGLIAEGFRKSIPHI